MLHRAACLLLVMTLAACGPYHLRGHVVEGETTAVLLVDQNDARLHQPGLDGAKIELTLDPSSMRPKRLADAITGPDGHFDVIVEEFGAGALEYELGLLVRRSGFQTLYQTIGLPGRDRRLIIMLQPGRDRTPPKESILDETLRLKDQMR